jgi:NAD(P)-dependent dehydrogenase (short-subunit alcohol dehydrogenase family)
VAEAVGKAGRLDVLVNNAGVMQEAKVEDMSLANWERTLAVNLTAPFLLIKAALPQRARSSILVRSRDSDRTRATPPIAPAKRDCTA